MVFEEGDLVWAKVKGHSQWPARVEGIVKSKRKGAEPPKYRVFFYGTHETGVVSEPNLKPYEQFKDKFKRPLQRQGFAEGIWEIEEDPQLSMVNESSTNMKGRRRSRKAPPEQQGAKKVRHSNDENVPTATPIPSPPTATPTTLESTAAATGSRLTRSSSKRASLRRSSGPPKAGSCNSAMKQECFDTSDVLSNLTVPTGGGLADITNSVSTQPMASEGAPRGEGASYKPLAASPCGVGSNVMTVGGVTPKSSVCRSPDRGGRSGLLEGSMEREVPLSPIVVTPPMRRPTIKAATPPDEPQTAEVETVYTTPEAPLDLYPPTEHQTKPLTDESSPAMTHCTSQDLHHMDTSFQQPPGQAGPEVCPALGDTVTGSGQANGGVRGGGVSSSNASGEGLMTEEATIDIDAFKEQHLRPVPMETTDQVVSVKGAPHDPSPVDNTPCGQSQVTQPHTTATESTSQLTSGAQLPVASRDTTQDGEESLQPLASKEQAQTAPANNDNDNDTLSTVTDGGDGPPVVTQDKKGRKGRKGGQEQVKEKEDGVRAPLGAGPRAVGRVSSLAGRGKGKQKKCDTNEVKHLCPPKTATTVELLTTLNYNIKCALRREQPNMYRAMRHLNDLHYLEVDSETLSKVPDLVKTIRKLRHYKGNKKVEKKAAEIFNKFKGLFVVGVQRLNKDKAATSSEEKTSTDQTSSSSSECPSLLDVAEAPHSAESTTADDTEAEAPRSPHDEGTQMDATTSSDGAPTSTGGAAVDDVKVSTLLEDKQEDLTTSSAGLGEVKDRQSANAVDDTEVDAPSPPPHVDKHDYQEAITSDSAGEVGGLLSANNTTADGPKADTPCSLTPEDYQEEDITNSSAGVGDPTVTEVQAKQVVDAIADSHLTWQGMEAIMGRGDEVDQMVP